MTNKLNISKISDKEEILDVQGQSCVADCTDYFANMSSAEMCGYYQTCNVTCIL